MKTISVISILLTFGFVSLSQAEDPLLGIVRGIKCLNCVKDSVVLLVDDPIEGQELEVMVPTLDYNKILTSLQGRHLHMKPEGCFYWIEKSKNPISKSGSAGVTVADSLSLKNQALTASEGKESKCIPYRSQSKGIN
jgi:hypothetical protein